MLSCPLEVGVASASAGNDPKVEVPAGLGAVVVCCDTFGQCGASSLNPVGCSVIFSEHPGTSIMLQRKEIQSGLRWRELQVHYFLFPSLHFRKREMVYFPLKMCLVALVAAAVYFESLLTAEK